MKTSKLSRLVSIVLVFCFFFEINLSGLTNAYAAGNSTDPAIALTGEELNNESISPPEDPVSENEGYAEITDKRELGIKYFMLGNGRYEAVMYGSPVHYLDNGEYKDIDNSLSLKNDNKGRSYYTNKSNSFKVFIAASTDGGWSAGISQGSYEMKWKLEGARTGKIGAASTYLSKNDWNKLSKKDQRTELPNLSSQVKYSDVLSNTVIDYQVISDIMKESITINSYNGVNVFNQRISLKGLDLIQKDDGTIVAVDSNDYSKEIFYLPKPFAIDSGYDENFNEDIEVTLRNINDIDEVELSVIENTDEQTSEVTDTEELPATTDSPEEISEPKNTELPEGVEDPTDLDDSNTEVSTPAVEEATTPTAAPQETETPTPSEVPEVIETPDPTESSIIEEKTSEHLFEGATNTYILTYTLDPDYLKNATYPVVIDPSVKTTLTTTNILDSRINEVYHDTNYKNSYLTCTGNGSSSGTNYALVNFKEMPRLEASCMITSAIFKMEKESTSSVSSYVAVHQVTQAWTEEGVTWDSFFDERPGYQTYAQGFEGQHWNPEVEDFYQVGTAAGGQYPWDVTQIVKEWYSGSPRYGLILMDMSTPYKGWCTADSYGKEPCIEIQYVDYSGLESYWDYATAGLDRSGTANANMYNGNLVYTHTDLAMTGNLMPVSISHIFNSTTRNDDILYGKGWRTNYDQRVDKIDHTLPEYSGFTEDYYSYIDGDGTVHYFAKNDDNKWMEESGLGYEITFDENNIPTITDNNDNKMVFYVINHDNSNSGYLNYIEDHNGNSQTIGYDNNNRINKITDGAGREVLLSRYSDGYLEKISEEIAADTYRDISFTYTNKKLTRITYPDGNYTEFSYDPNGNIDHVYGVDGKHLDITYQSSFEGAEPYRISHMSQSTATQDGSELSFEYGYNLTKVKDSEERTATYEFNDRGNTVCIIGPDGSAGYASFGTEGGGDMGKITSASKSQKFGKNFVNNHNMEASTSTIWTWGESEASATEAYATDQKNLGAKSIKIVKSLTSGYAYATQDIPLEAGQTYTVSGYIRTSGITGTGGALIKVVQGSTEYANTQFVTGSSGVFERYCATFTLPDGSSPVTVSLRLEVINASGSAWFDCIQLEKGPIMNRYNIIENADFDFVTNGIPDKWTRGSNCTSNDIVITDSSNPNNMSDKRFHFVGSPSQNKYIEQQLHLTGQKGDCYVIGAWCKGNSVPLHNSTIKYGMAARFDSDAWEYGQWQFNTGTDEWQYLCAKIVAKGSYTNLTLRVELNYNANEVVFDGIQVFKEGFDNELKYYDDDEVGGNEGDLHYIKYPDGNVEHFTYDSKHNMLTDDPQYNLNTNTNSQYVSNYTYDAYNNPLTATSSTGVVTTYNYDSNQHGLLLGTKVGNDTNNISSATTYDNENNYVAKTTDPFGKEVNYTYDTFTGLLRDVTDPLQKTVHNTYDEGVNGTYQLTDVFMTSDNMTVSNSYDYTKYRLTQVSHNAPGGSVDFNINYNSLGWNTGTSVGTQVLVTNNLEARTGRLNGVTYGNGQALSYAYDDYDRLIKASQGTTDLYGYAYDLCGRVGYMKDYVQNVEYRYEYDIMDRAIKTYKKDLTTGSITTSAYTYNTQSQMTGFNESVDSTTYIMGYTYDYGKRPDTSTFKTLYQGSYSDTYSKDIAYDNTLGTVTGYSLIKNGASFYSTSVDYYDGTEMGDDAISTNSSRVKSITNGGETLSYEHDDRGFITKVEKDADNYSEYRFDGFGQLVRENYKWGTTRYTMIYSYDVGGNITSRTKYAFANMQNEPGGDPISTITYSYGDTNWRDKLTSFTIGTSTTNITYDDIGNPLNDGTRTYTWTQGRRLSTVSNGSTSASYIYNSSGIRTQKTVGTVETVFNLVGDNITWQKTGTNIIYFIYDVSGKLWGLKYNGAEYFYVRNAQGDIIKIVNSSGTVVVEYAYDSWGKQVSMTGDQTLGNVNPFRYRGYYFDNETGLYYLYQRYYNPEWGRFINADSYGGSTGALLGHNVFAYCVNNPVMGNDPNGNFWYYGNTQQTNSTSFKEAKKNDTMQKLKQLEKATNNTMDLYYIHEAMNNIDSVLILNWYEYSLTDKQAYAKYDFESSVSAGYQVIFYTALAIATMGATTPMEGTIPAANVVGSSIRDTIGWNVGGYAYNELTKNRNMPDGGMFTDFSLNYWDGSHYFFIDGRIAPTIDNPLNSMATAGPC